MQLFGKEYTFTNKEHIDKFIAIKEKIKIMDTTKLTNKEKDEIAKIAYQSATQRTRMHARSISQIISYAIVAIFIILFVFFVGFAR